jgi:hypothetical protein
MCGLGFYGSVLYGPRFDAKNNLNFFHLREVVKCFADFLALGYNRNFFLSRNITKNYVLFQEIEEPFFKRGSNHAEFEI